MNTTHQQPNNSQTATFPRSPTAHKKASLEAILEQWGIIDVELEKFRVRVVNGVNYLRAGGMDKADAIRFWATCNSPVCACVDAVMVENLTELYEV